MNEQVVINNLLISYSNFSFSEARPTLLFLHGWRSSKEVWRGIVGQLISESANKQISGAVNAEYNIYALDLPGFGGSQVPPQSFGVGEYAQIVKGFIEKLQLKNITLIGHSFGGKVSIKLASQHPELISKLVLVDSAAFPMNQQKKSFLAVAAKMVKPLFKAKFMQGLRKKIYKAIGAEDYIATPGLQETFVKVVNEDMTEDLKKISCPTLVIFGQMDEDTPVSFASRIQGLVKNSKGIILPMAGHFSFLDRPAEFLKTLIEFTGS